MLDEARTYTGARGTEVAHLVRRLKERLGLSPGSSSFRAIATTASLPSEEDSEEELLQFASGLFDEPPDRFTLVQLPKPQGSLPPRAATPKAFAAFERFQRSFSAQEPFPSITQLADDLDLGSVDSSDNPQEILYSLLEHNEDIAWLRGRTARNATPLVDLSAEVWPNLGNAGQKEIATAGMLTAGSFARPAASPDIQPLLSVRIHAFFRGIAGLWACMDPNCAAVPEDFKSPGLPRPLGKLYTDPRPWCECGARVLELFSCRRCGLLFLGGIPDQKQGSLWPWSDDLVGEGINVREFRIFGVEQPNPFAQPGWRSIRTTLEVHQNEPFARQVFEDWEPANVPDTEILITPFPMKCPRCQSYTQPGSDGREVIEPLRTKGPQSFSLVVEDGFRVQPRASHGKPPNFGRKALLFTDSRQEAAKLAGDLRADHARDVFRQVLYRALHGRPASARFPNSDGNSFLLLA